MATYYVNAAAAPGGDGSITTPFNTIAAMQAKADGYAAGDFILFNRGDTWRETLTPPSSGSSGSPITFGAYDTGDDPIINGANIVSSWTAYEAVSGETGDLLSDNFDDGNFTGWTDTGTPTMDDSLYYTTSYSVKFNEAESLKKSHTGAASLYGRLYLYVTTTPGTGSAEIAHIFDGTTRLGTLYMEWIEGAVKMMFWNNVAWNAYGPSAAMSTGAWHYIEWFWQKGAATGALTLKLDGTTFYTGTSINFGTADANAILIGPSGAMSGWDYNIDNVDIDSAGWLGAITFDTDIWYAAVTTEPNQVMFNDILGTKVASIVACTSDKKWFWASNVLYTYGTEDPNTTYPNQIEASQRDYCINLSANYITIDSICVEKGNSNFAGAIMVGGTSSYVTVQNCEARWNYVQGIHIYGTAGSDLKFIDNLIHDNGMGIWAEAHAGASSGHECYIDGNTVYDNRGISGLGDAIHVYGNYYIIQNNIVHDNGTTDTDGIGIHIYTDEGNTDYGHHNIVRYNIVYNQLCNNSDGSGIELDYTTAYNEIYYNICFHNYGPGIDFWNSNHNTVYNNVCYNNVQNASFAGMHAEISCANNSSYNDYKNNIAYAVQTNIYAIGVDDGSADLSNTIVNNELYAPNSSNFYYWNTAAGNNLTTFNGLTGVDDNLNSNPLMTDPANADFTLQSSSPCINAGVDVGLTTDYEGKAVSQGGAADIGAYEYNSCGMFF